ncbi:PREDICTED: uncharacterized protein C2orf78-like [Dipodomys ordii]|uniref:Uncharacterized protein C2orf78-like n=1 Tax=Dipodomys ordii TaxID=10020 RepID=A0A1S3GQQ4_DIPOR|nr:PREDICTED: uncharacterized protein C2orf78-like [Dipodomys ordii]
MWPPSCLPPSAKRTKAVLAATSATQREAGCREAEYKEPGKPLQLVRMRRRPAYDDSSEFVNLIHFSTTLLLIADNFQHPSLLGARNSLQLSLPVVSDATSLTGNVYNFSRASTPVDTLAWSSISGTFFQTLMGNNYIYQPSSTPMLSGITGQNHMPTSTSSCPSAFVWDYLGKKKEKKSSGLGDFTATLIDQGTAVPSMAVTSRYVDANAIVTLYPSLSAGLVQGTLSQISNQGHSLLLSYCERNQVYYYSLSTGVFVFRRPWSLLAISYVSVSYTGSRASVPQSEIMIMSKEVQPTSVLLLDSTSGTCYFVSAQHITETNFQDFIQSNVSITTDIKDTETINEILLQENSMVTKHSTGQVQRNKHEALESVDGTPEVKVECQPPELLLEEEVTVCTIPSSDQASVNTDKHSDSKSPKAASSKVSKTKSHAQKETKRIRENHPKKCDETKQPGNKIKKEEKTSIPKTKHKRSHPELSQETFKRPRTNLGVQMWESVQVFHALGKKNEKKKELPSPKALRNASSTQETKSTPAVKSRLGIPHEGKGPKITQVKKRDRSESQCPSPTQDELPPPGKVKLVPLPFLAPEKPQARPVSRRPQSLASRRPTVPYRTLPCSNTAQPTAVSRSQPATANTCFIASQPIAANRTKQGLTTTPQPSVSQSTVARPEPYKT